MLITRNSLICSSCGTERQAIEIFHLHFLRAFSARVNKSLFALKGGCNLRFYHRSIRYSEGMDLDIRTMAPATLRSNVATVLDANSFRQALRAQQLEVAQFSAPKQTQTTQRWKIQLRLPSLEPTIPTKIEFSRRALDQGVALAAVEAEVIRAYRLYPVLVQHYGAAAAFAQKISALALSTETQARDIFDLKLLADAGAASTPLRKLQLEQLPQAIDNAMSMGFEEFVGQVVAFLEPEHQAGFPRPRHLGNSAGAGGGHVARFGAVNQIEALRRLQQVGAPVFETRDASALLDVTPANANMILRRLADQNLITHLSRGRWAHGRFAAAFRPARVDLSSLSGVRVDAIGAVSSRAHRADPRGGVLGDAGQTAAG